MPVERITKIFEALFNLDRDLTAELLYELRQCSAADLESAVGDPSAPAVASSAGVATPTETSPDGDQVQPDRR
jgi:hypothetical protein